MKPDKEGGVMVDKPQQNNVESNTPKHSSRRNFLGTSKAAFVKMGTAVKSHKAVSIAGALVLVVVVAGLTVWLIAQNNNANRQVTSGEVSAEYQRRLPELEQAAKDSPNDATARKNYAVALYATGDLEKARDEYNAAVKINDRDAVAYNNLGNIYRDLGDTNKAVESYRKSLEINNSAINTYVNLANVQLYSQNNSDAAIATYKDGLKNLPDNEQLQLLLGIAYEQADQISNAKQSYQTILAKNGDNAAAKANLDRLNNQ